MNTDSQLIKEQYRRMNDQELLWFANNESQAITPGAFSLLVAEFERRGLDGSVIESAAVDRQIVEATKISEFERTTAEMFTQTIWAFALDQKRHGATNAELFEALLQKHISPEYAHMLIESIEPQMEKALDSLKTQTIVGWVLLVTGLGLFIITLEASLHSKMFFLFGSSMFIAGLVRLITCSSSEKKCRAILENIQAEREIVAANRVDDAVQ
jgi:hypothetical protein